MSDCPNFGTKIAASGLPIPVGESQPRVALYPSKVLPVGYVLSPIVMSWKAPAL